MVTAESGEKFPPRPWSKAWDFNILDILPVGTSSFYDLLKPRGEEGDFIFFKLIFLLILPTISVGQKNINSGYSWKSAASENLL